MEELDQQVVNLAKSIKRAETGEGDTYNSIGDNGTSRGAYQFQPTTWKNLSKQHLGIENAEMTRENQNKVAYMEIKRLKDQGYTPAQIASYWNSGDFEAYKTGKKGYNERIGVEYDVPAYVTKVSDNYRQLSPTIKPEEVKVTDKVEEKPTKTGMEKVTDVVTKIFPGKKVGEAIGTSIATIGAGLKYGKEAAKEVATTSPRPAQVAGDVLQGALTVATPGAGKALGSGGRIAQTTALGAGMGLGGGLAEGEKGQELGKTVGTGAVLGGALGAGGEIARKIAQYLPKRIVPTKFDAKTTEHMMSKPLKKPSKMLKDSQREIEVVGNKLDKVLEHADYKGVRVPARDIYSRVVEELPDANITPDQLKKDITGVAKLKAGLVDKLFSPEGLDLVELRRLNSEIGKHTFKKTILDSPKVKANKEIGAKVYFAIKDAITSIAPETDEMFGTLSKEIQLSSALERYLKKGSKIRPLSLKDLLVFQIGNVPAVAAERIATSPASAFKTAGVIKGLGTEGFQKTAKTAGMLGIGSLSR